MVTKGNVLSYSTLTFRGQGPHAWDPEGGTTRTQQSNYQEI